MSAEQSIIARWNEGSRTFFLEGGDCLFIQRLRALSLSDEQIAGVLTAIEETCNVCWDADQGCQCWNDE